MKTGTEDKRKVTTLIVLLAIAVPVGIWEVRGYFATRSAENPAPNQGVPAAARPGATGANDPNGPEAERIASTDVNPTLHLDKLAQSEGVDYRGTGRNIFSADSAPIRIEKPLLPARPNPNGVTVVVSPPVPTSH